MFPAKHPHNGMCVIVQVQLLVSDSDVESYKQIKADLDVLRQSVEKSELWVYKSRSVEEHGKKKKDKDDGEDEGREHKEPPKKSPPPLSASEKQGSAIDLDIGPLLHPDQAEEYKKMQQVHIWHILLIFLIIAICWTVFLGLIWKYLLLIADDLLL
jgi:hypothetical protein